MEKKMELTSDQEKWASKSRQKVSKSKLREILITQNGECALSHVKMIFDIKEGTPIKGGIGCHPLYPAVDHIDPGNAYGDVQIVCYALNDLKGHLPPSCFSALQETPAWKSLMYYWQEQAKSDPFDRQAFKKLLRPNATL
jgi:hypothetical protein